MHAFIALRDWLGWEPGGEVEPGDSHTECVCMDASEDSFKNLSFSETNSLLEDTYLVVPFFSLQLYSSYLASRKSTKEFG
jgi:hypothetical protein